MSSPHTTSDPGKDRLPSPASPSVSVIICTKDRPAELALCLDSLARQVVHPAEVIVVDASNTPAEREVAEFQSKVGCAYAARLFPASPGLTRQRNIGVRAASGSVILFIDDDTILGPAYIKEISAIYEQDTASQIGGVGGAIIPGSAFHDGWLHRTFKRLFFLPSLGVGRIKQSGHPEFLFSPRGVENVEFLSGCNMSYRREVFASLEFDERLVGYALGEDIHFSYAVSRYWKLVLTPSATLEHREAGAGRPVSGKRVEMGVVNHLLFFREQVATRPLHWICYFWSLAGGLLMTLRHAGEGRLTGLLRAYVHVATTLLTWRSRNLGDTAIPDHTERVFRRCRTGCTDRRPSHPHSSRPPIA